MAVVMMWVNEFLLTVTVSVLKGLEETIDGGSTVVEMR